MTERALIVAAQAGDQAAAGELVNRHFGQVVNATRGLFVPGLDEDDVDQERRYAILRAIELCDPDRPLGPLAAVVARRWILTMLIHERRERRRANYETAPDTVNDDGDHVPAVELIPDLHRLGPEDHLEWREETRRLARGVATLSELERRSLLGLAVGLTYAEIEGKPHDAYHVPRWVDNAVQRARRKLREAA